MSVLREVVQATEEAREALLEAAQVSSLRQDGFERHAKPRAALRLQPQLCSSQVSLRPLRLYVRKRISSVISAAHLTFSNLYRTCFLAALLAMKKSNLTARSVCPKRNGCATCAEDRTRPTVSSLETIIFCCDILYFVSHLFRQFECAPLDESPDWKEHQDIHV